MDGPVPGAAIASSSSPSISSPTACSRWSTDDRGRSLCEPRIAAHALELEDLDVVYRVRGRDRQVLRGVTLAVRRGEAYGLVGESGCGKSTAALAVVQYLPRNGRVRSGKIKIDGRDVLSRSRASCGTLRAKDVSMVYQNPGTALNPAIRVGKQVAEVFTVRGVEQVGRDRARARGLEARADRRSAAR